jgi:hypothetical protein
MASALDGLSSCLAAQASTVAMNSSDIRKARTGSLPVAGRPRFFGMTLLLDGLIFESYHKNEPTGRLHSPARL